MARLPFHSSAPQLTKMPVESVEASLNQRRPEALQTEAGSCKGHITTQPLGLAWSAVQPHLTIRFPLQKYTLEPWLLTPPSLIKRLKTN